MKRHQLGQYFTTHDSLKDHVFRLIKNHPDIILEPSMGRGDLVAHVSGNLNTDFDCYEIDRDIELLPSIDKNRVVYGDFLEQTIDRKYATIIGNPPYVKTQKGNLYIDFIEKCVELLKENGELIFIVPSDFVKLTSSSKVIQNMMDVGCFTDIVHPHNEHLFEGASIDVIVFRYCKNASLPKRVVYNGEEKMVRNHDGILTFPSISFDSCREETVSTYFDVYVGMVTGKEDVFKNQELGNVSVLNGENKIDKYILVDSFPSTNENLNNYLLVSKAALMERKIRKFNENNWYQWGALRNYETIKNNVGKPCIYVSTLTRSEKVAFVGQVQLFGGGLLVMIPKREFSPAALEKIVQTINSSDFRQHYLYSGRFKMGHKHLCNAVMDFTSSIMQS
jgi:adenine-specific DNA-methyltransferase